MVQPAGEPRHIDLIRGRLLLPLLAALFLAQGAIAQQGVPGTEWTRLPPARSGWSEAGLAEAQKLSERFHSTAVTVVHHGAVVAQWGDTTKRTELASIRKSLLSALIGIAAAEGEISLDGTLAALGIDDNPPELTEVEKQATVRMLLQARSGVYHAALYETAAMARARPQRGSHAPGTFFYYNNWDFNVLGTIYERATGSGVYDALARLIAGPIEMQDYGPKDGTYFTGPDSRHRAYPIRMSARDLARFALLYLRNGAWNGRQVVPAAWVHESTQPYSDTGFAGQPLGYGYLWWTAPRKGDAGPLGSGWYAAVGAGGQYAFVSPVHDLVVVSRVDRDLRLPERGIAIMVEFLNLVVKAAGEPAAR